VRVLWCLAVLALPACAQPTAKEVLECARAALGGTKLDSVQSLAVWGPDRHGAQSAMLALSIDLSGRFLKELTTFSSGGQVQRVGVSEDGATAGAGGMPGDDGGPALIAGTSEGLSAGNYWSRTPPGRSSLGNTAARQRSFADIFARFALAFTLSPPANFPVSFVYGGRLETPGGMADALDGIGPGDFSVRLFIDAKTHLPLMMNYRDSGRDVQLWLKEYRTEGGILFPHTVTWVADGELMEEFQAQRFRVNPKFRPEKFER
jgi:hypothetical protein